MQTHADQTRALRYGIPWALQVMPRLFWCVARHNVGANPFHPIQHRKGRGIEDDGLPAALAIGQE